MRKSNQLSDRDGCANGSKLNLSSMSPGIIRASCVNSLTKRILLGEPVEDIRGELESMFAAKKYKWENNTQKEENLSRYEKAITQFVNSEITREHTYLDGVDTTVNVLGEEIEAVPDFIVEENDGTISVCKISTGKLKVGNMTAEDYALGMLGKKLYPDKEIYVERLYMDINHDRNFDAPFNGETNFLFNDYVKERFELQQANEEAHECSEQACASCPKNNICHYEEPPVAVNVEELVRPVDDIRLTNAQRQIVDYEIGTARVNAGAGAGKTLVVALRVAELLAKGYKPEDFALLTFTKAGAEEMTARVMSYAAAKGVPLDPERFTSGTINSFCQNIISEYYAELGYTRPPRVVPDEIRYSIIHDVVGNRFPKIKGWNYSTFQDTKKWNPWIRGAAINEASKMFADIKANEYTRQDNPYNWTDDNLDILFGAYDAYNEELKNRAMIEYSDQLNLVMKLSESHPDLFEEMGYKHIIVDEFQDTDLGQIKLLNKMIDTQCFKSFMAVGDDSQSIFAFRHTSPEYMIHFDTYFGHFDDFTLAENHRSNKATINFANEVNALAHERVIKDLIPTKEEGIKPKIQGYYTPNEEYKAIATDIKRRWDEGERDIAVMASTKNELKEIASALTKEGVPSVLMCPTPYIENSRVAAITTFYDSFFSGTTQGFADYKNILESGAFKDLPAEEIERQAEGFKNEIEGETKSLANFIKFAKALDENEIDACYQNFLEKLEFCEDTNELREFMNSFKLYGIDSEYKREGKFEGVCLTTVHSAKGLEWDTTYLSLSKFDSIKNHRNSRAFERSGEHDEIIRKWFVGATRARKELIMTGQYLLQKPKRDGVVFNDYVVKSYQMLGKAFGYNYASYQAQTELEKHEAAEAALQYQAKQQLELTSRNEVNEARAQAQNEVSKG